MMDDVLLMLNRAIASLQIAAATLAADEYIIESDDLAKIADGLSLHYALIEEKM
jgi:hypothetical protein